MALLALVCASAVLAAPFRPKALPPRDLSAAAADAVIPDVVIDAKGDTIVVWAQAVGSNWTVDSVYRPAGGSWSAPVALSAPSSHVASPQVAVAGSTVVATWVRYNGKNLITQVAERDPRTGSWSAPVSLPSGGDAQAPTIAVDARGDAVVVWADVGLTSWTIESSYRPAGGSWEDMALVDSPEQGTAQSEVAMDGAGNATAVWAATDGGTGWTVRASSRAPEGTWSTPAVLSGPDATGSVAPRIALEGNGDATVVWSRTVGDVTDLELTTRRAATGTWSAAKKLFPGARTFVAPQIATNARGDGVIVWTSSEPAGFTVETSVRRRGKNWSKPTRLVLPNTGALAPRVAIDGHGAAIAVWARAIGSVSRVQMASLPANGTQWSAAQTLSRAGADALTPQTALDSGGDGAIAWSRFEGSTFVIQAAGYDATGPALNSLVLPAAGTVGKRLAFSVAPKDVWSPVASVRWTFGDGSFTSSKATSHVYAQAGRYTVRVAATDSAGHVRTISRVVTIAAS